MNVNVKFDWATESTNAEQIRLELEREFLECSQRGFAAHVDMEGMNGNPIVTVSATAHSVAKMVFKYCARDLEWAREYFSNSVTDARNAKFKSSKIAEYLRKHMTPEALDHKFKPVKGQTTKRVKLWY